MKCEFTHEPFKPRVPVHGKLVSEFNQSNSSTTPTQLRWKPEDIPHSPTDFIDGLYTVCGAGCSFLRDGFAIHMNTANKSMDNCAFCNADGDILIVPQEGSLDISCAHLLVLEGSRCLYISATCTTIWEDVILEGWRYLEQQCRAFSEELFHQGVSGEICSTTTRGSRH